MKRDNLQTIVEIFTNRGFDVNVNDHNVYIKDKNHNIIYVNKKYIKTHKFIDELIIEISSEMKLLQKKCENKFIKELIERRLSSHVEQYLYTEQFIHVITIPPCESSRLELLKEEFRKYRTLKFKVIDLCKDGVFLSIKYKIENK